MGKSWSCYDLHNSVFLAPNEIRTCCKRFFHENTLKGDVVAIEASEDSNYSVSDIRQAKKKIYEEMNSKGGYNPCNGCPHLEFKDWGGSPIENGIDYLSLEYHSICNMRCLYCCDTYFGGKQASYSVVNLVDEFIDNGLLTNTNYLVWGGGEPTLDRNFNKILDSIVSMNIGPRIRMISNSTNYSEEIKKGIDEDKVFLVTSVDAGTSDVFRKVRGLNGFDRVLNNLNKYSRDNPQNIIVKYIIRDDNCSFDELDSFVEQIIDNDLIACNFQLSCDFKEEDCSPNILASIIYLHNKLRIANVRFIFMDDLIIQRMPKVNDLLINNIDKELKEVDFNLSNYLSFKTKPEYDKLYIIGTGSQAKALVKRLSYVKGFSSIIFVDPNNSFSSNKIDKFPVIKIDEMPNKSNAIIGAVQSSPFIYQSLLSQGKANNLIEEFIL